MTEKHRKMTKAEAGHLGGLANASKGSAYMSKLGKRGGTANKNKMMRLFGPSYFMRIGRMGGRPKKVKE